MSFIAGDYREVIRQEMEDHERYVQSQHKKQDDMTTVEECESDEMEREVTLQTFPDIRSSVIRQDSSDLTCGMRCLQNMYGQHIVNREEMDQEAKQLEKRSFGVKMYNENLGFYNIEVLKAVLMKRGKHVQRIDHEKIPVDYFHPCVKMNPTFSGYIVALGIDGVNHYVTVRCHSHNIRVVDSLPNVAPLDVAETDLFCSGPENTIKIFPKSEYPVIAIMAVASTPFVEYTLMHDTWPSDQLPSVEGYLRAVTVQDRRPNAETFQKMRDMVWAAIQTHSNVIVRMQDHKAIIRCRDVSEIVSELLQRQWIQHDRAFYLNQSGRALDVDFESSGTLGSRGIQLGVPIDLSHETYVPNQAQVGGFYRFNCDVQGKCIGAQQRSYSVIDKDGKVHVVYKNTISSLERIKN